MRSPLSVPGAPAAIGPYSQAQVVRLHGGNRLVFTSGQVALDPETGELKGADIAAQTEQVLKNLAAVLSGAGLELADVVKTTVFLADMADFQGMNQVYEKHFPSPAPARTTVAAAGLPRGARVEIEAVAVGRDL
ncbi:MAG: RidA family protein [Candidatus Eisenbacteria bacterium]|uniref:RidA family protein n=1 Tax=Eiseniibacteriota bacterium TaxID=2212470 RepID=A0A538SGY7_UNCEI|nr:MAG: RidA family protein [Candidatus Eisenbacteria bacterium]